MLSQYLLTAHWFAQQLGFSDSKKMLFAIKSSEEERVLETLKLQPDLKIPLPLLHEMDENISMDMEIINRNRPEPIVLKYFQYLAVLASEYMLYRLAQSQEQLPDEINKCAVGSMPNIESENINKLAFWMATGAGKTLIMHLNILQFRRYQHSIFIPDNTIIITPNETMTAQHLAELHTSGISARLFSENASMFDSVVVLDIHKLSDKKGKKGMTRTPEVFTGRNLIFVDEGHKGSSGGDDGYFNKRDRLVKDDGFSFEYSATFGQAINPAKNIERVEQYGRAILFDYSYRHFYGDKYGKDFFLINVRNQHYEDAHKDIFMFANLLAFFQQQLAYLEHPQACAEFQIEKPLLLMLGQTVTGGKDTATKHPDIIKIASFLRRVTLDRNREDMAWTEQAASEIISGHSGIEDENNHDMFSDKFDLLAKKYHNQPAQLCSDLRKILFHHEGRGDLLFRPLKQRSKTGKQNPEIALQIDGAKLPFALIYVGNSSKLCEIAQEENFVGFDDFLRTPLFPDINDPESPINILIGAKKFMEGWSSWRVSGMGLLNVGKGEGPMIIQLFGRGVRLQGKNWSLKRNGGEGLSDDERAAVRILEMLNIFAISADFMSRFRDHLKKEGAITEEVILPVYTKNHVNETLHHPAVAANNGDFEKSDNTIFLRPAENLYATVDLSSRYVAAEGLDIQTIADKAQGESFALDEEILPRINITDLYCRIQKYAATRDWKNLVITPSEIPSILAKCNIRMDSASGGAAALVPGTRLQGIAFKALRKYTDKVYGKSMREWEQENIQILPLEFKGDNKHANFKDYTLSLQNTTEEYAREIKAEIEKWVQQNQQEEQAGAYGFVSLINVHFDWHLSQPLLAENQPNSQNQTSITSSPVGLNDGEEKFVRYLKKFSESDSGIKMLANKAKIFLLRNLPKIGVNLTLETGDYFYPDFMLWVLSDKKERLVFVDPKGMQHFGDKEDAKMQIWKYLHKISQKQKFREKKIEVDSFLISVTPYEKIPPGVGNTKQTKDEFQKKHLLFLEDMNPNNESKAKKAFSCLLGLPVK